MLKGQKSENITETHQNKAQNVKITAQKVLVRVGTVLKGQISKNLMWRLWFSNIDIIYMTETHQKGQKANKESKKNVYGPYFNDELALLWRSVTFCHAIVTQSEKSLPFKLQGLLTNCRQILVILSHPTDPTLLLIYKTSLRLDLRFAKRRVCHICICHIH